MTDIPTQAPVDVPAVDPVVVEVDRGPDAVVRDAFAGRVGVLGATEGQDPNSLSPELSDKVSEGLADAAKEYEKGKMEPEEATSGEADPYGIWVGKADRSPGVYEFKPLPKPVDTPTEAPIAPPPAAQ